MQTPKLRIFTIVYGDQYLDWFKRALCRSLSWPLNREALQGAKWTIFGQVEHGQQRVYEAASKVIPFSDIEMEEVIMHSPGQPNLLACMVRVLRKCLDDKCPMLTAPPDTIFSDGSIPTLLEFGKQKDTCVAVPHPRVKPDIMGWLNETPPANDALVTMALEQFAHDAWTAADPSLALSACHVGGILQRKISPGLWALQHRLPTIYLSNFTDDDRRYFAQTYMGQPIQYGCWDHEWPGEMVIPKERQRLLGSSDLAFICEVTNPWSNTPPITMTNPVEPDSFHRSELHNKINRCYVSVFRGQS